MNRIMALNGAEDHFRSKAALQSGRAPLAAIPVTEHPLGNWEMTKSPYKDSAEAERESLKIRLASLEADVAYFQARLAILGEPATANQVAQQKVYKLLKISLDYLILENRRRLQED